MGSLESMTLPASSQLWPPRLLRPQQHLARGAPCRLPPKCCAQETPGPATWWSARARPYPVRFQARRDYRCFLVLRRAWHGDYRRSAAHGTPCLATRWSAWTGGYPTRFRASVPPCVSLADFRRRVDHVSRLGTPSPVTRLSARAGPHLRTSQVNNIVQ